MTGPRSAIWLPLFEDLADPLVVTRLAVEAEEHGWHGLFVWDQLRWRAPVQRVADPWITLASVAAATERLRLGPMVTPLARRRPAKVARETATLDLLSGGRLILGAGLGGDNFAAEFSASGEQVDDRVRARMLDEALAILTSAWSGEPVEHRGEHYTVDGIRFLPRPVQRPTIPVWIAGSLDHVRPRRRAARHQGFFPMNLRHPDQFAEAVATITGLRAPATTPPGAATAEPYDFAVALAGDADPTPYLRAGATWWMPEFDVEDATPANVRARIREGPLIA